MAFWAWVRGYMQEGALKQLQGATGFDWIGPQRKPTGKVVRREIPRILARADVQTAFRLWTNYKRFGLPFACGWAEHPAIMVATLSLFETEMGKWEAEQRENDSGRAKAGHKSRGR